MYAWARLYPRHKDEQRQSSFDEQELGKAEGLVTG